MQHMDLDPECRPPEYRVPRGRSGLGARTALEQWLKDMDRVRRAKQAWGDLPRQDGSQPPIQPR